LDLDRGVLRLVIGVLVRTGRCAMNKLSEAMLALTLNKLNSVDALNLSLAVESVIDSANVVSKATVDGELQDYMTNNLELNLAHLEGVLEELE